MLKEFKKSKWYFITFTLLLVINIIIYLIRNPFLNRLSFLITGIYAIAILYLVIVYGSRCCNIKLNRVDIRLLIGFISVAFLIYCILILSRNTIYVWDSTVHYNNLTTLLKKFDHSNITGFVHIIKTGLVYDYGSFLLLFIYPFYFFANKNIQMFNLTYFMGAVVPVIIVLYILGLYIVSKFKTELKDNIKVKCSILVTLIFFPLLHVSTILGRPDIIGLAFVGILILLTIDYDFEYKDIIRWIILFVTTITLSITRRWYLYFIVGYYLSYALILIIKSIRKRKIKNIINLSIFGCLSIVMVLILLKPLIYKILSTNYSKLYIAFDNGGILFELSNQLYYLGFIMAIIIVVGYVYLIYNKKTRVSACTFILTYIIAMLLFLRIQNFEEHQSLIFVPTYLLGIFGFIAKAYEKKQRVNYVARYAFITIILLSFINCSCFNYYHNIADKLLSVIDMYPYRRTDLSAIGQVVDYINETADDKDKVTVLAAGDDYDSAYFVHYPEPYKNSKVIYINTFLVNEGFPINFFSSKYCVLILPLQQWSGVEEQRILYNIVDLFLNDDYIKEKFVKKKEIQLKEGITAYIYERIDPVDSQEVDIFISRFQCMNDEYGDLFYKKLENYKKHIK